MRRERLDMALWMEDIDGALLCRGWIALSSLCCRSARIESGICGRLGAVFETVIGDDGDDSGSKRAVRTAASWGVRPDA
jgi:hypothetical protein